EKHFKNKKRFIRSKVAEFVNHEGKRMVAELRRHGYNKESPNKEYVVRKIMERANNFQGMIDIYIESQKEEHNDHDSAEKALLPDSYNSSPEVIFMTIPNEGAQNRCHFDWQKDVAVPMYKSEEKVIYGVSAFMAIKETHYVSWRRDCKNGQMHYADSMGDSRESVTIPVVVSMPDQNTEAALELADQKANDSHRHFREAKSKLEVLGSQVALVMLTRKKQ
ncbi:hypothetical protein, partial [Endozoicomonas sp. ONNA2]|uniref:hypothetical protein n=1 Tax=Endozoicomonas sp. ONNA2 TaxID=2828741 RepID=UPI0021486216